MTEGPAPVERDSRGILDPWLLRQRLALSRYPAGPTLDGLMDHFWAIRWDLPAGVQHRQEVLTHPVANISISHPDARSGSSAIEARLSGVARKLTWLDGVIAELRAGTLSWSREELIDAARSFAEVLPE
jgi:hypothetical protein